MMVLLLGISNCFAQISAMSSMQNEYNGIKIMFKVKITLFVYPSLLFYVRTYGHVMTCSYHFLEYQLSRCYLKKLFSLKIKVQICGCRALPGLPECLVPQGHRQQHSLRREVSRHNALGEIYTYVIIFSSSDMHAVFIQFYIFDMIYIRILQFIRIMHICTYDICSNECTVRQSVLISVVAP